GPITFNFIPPPSPVVFNSDPANCYETCLVWCVLPPLHIWSIFLNHPVEMEGDR
ncbi:hypothetical protein AVEN_267509-1, partial [Araneus ventricosus]